MKGVKLEGRYREIRRLAVLLVDSYIPFCFQPLTYGYQILCCGKVVREDDQLTPPGVGSAVLVVDGLYEGKGITAYVAHLLLLGIFENGRKSGLYAIPR